MEKVRPYDAAAAAAHHAACGPPVMAIDTMHELVFEMRDEKQETPRGTSRKANKLLKSERRRFRSKCV
jgi:tRNA (guanine10-N2)-methyltransferase